MQRGARRNRRFPATRNSVADRRSDPGVLVISGGKIGKVQGLCIEERERGLGVISKRNVAAP